MTPPLRWRRRALAGVASLAALLIALVGMQLFFVGRAVFVTPAAWAAHIAVGHTFSYPIMAMFLLCLITRLPRRFLIYSIVLYALYALQYAFLRVHALQALHALNPLLLLAAAGWVGAAAWRERKLDQSIGANL